MCCFGFIRNSTALVEAGFDGEVDEIKELMEKGYHIESRDGRKHTALSEAACQGHSNVIEFLVSVGADPNTCNDTGRTPIWRAAFNGHAECVQLLLEAGGDPDCKDNTSIESAYDVAKSEDIREMLVSPIHICSSISYFDSRSITIAAVSV